ncbi:MAG: hypothetical protein M3220_00610 [Chloroflexota bacterium]|nr:hypothetical protein [Chloroflexota bacterium]
MHDEFRVAQALWPAFVSDYFWVWLHLGFLLGVVAQLYRYVYVSSSVERHQTKWVLFGLMLPVLSMMLITWLPAWLPTQGAFGALRTLLSALRATSLELTFLVVLPFTLAIAILRYRLYDIDILINKTLVYALLTVALALTYFGIIVLLQYLFRTLTGQDSNAAIVISTLVIYALFNPLRQRIQAFIDRRFYRRKYDAQKTLAAFAATVRNEVELEQLTGELLRVIEETMQPAHISLWLRSDVPVHKEDTGRSVER